MAQNRCLTLLLAILVATISASGAQASRASEDSRGLPWLLEVDGSDIRLLPATVSILAPQLTVETSRSSYAPQTDPSTYSDFALALTGRRIRFGYFLDGASQNLVMGGPGGWGVALGFTDRYGRDESFTQSTDRIDREDTEEWERTFRLGVGWRKEFAGGRLLEIGVGGSLIQGEKDVEVYDLRNGDVSHYNLRWKADRGTGIETTLRTLAPGGGIQAAARFRYDDLQPDEGESAFEPRIVRQSAALDLGWRASIPALDDFVAGVALAWWNEEDTVFDSYSSWAVREEEEIRYRGAVFISAQKEVTDRLIIRGGLRGPAQFDIDKSRTFKREGEEYMVSTEQRRSSGSTGTPQVYIGAGYRWRDLVVDAQVNHRVDLYYPLVRWSARLEF